MWGAFETEPTTTRPICRAIALLNSRLVDNHEIQRSRSEQRSVREARLSSRPNQRISQRNSELRLRGVGHSAPDSGDTKLRLTSRLSARVCLGVDSLVKLERRVLSRASWHERLIPAVFERETACSRRCTVVQFARESTPRHTQKKPRNPKARGFFVVVRSTTWRCGKELLPDRRRCLHRRRRFRRPGRRISDLCQQRSYRLLLSGDPLP